MAWRSENYFVPLPQILTKMFSTMKKMRMMVIALTVMTIAAMAPAAVAQQTTQNVQQLEREIEQHEKNIKEKETAIKDLEARIDSMKSVLKDLENQKKSLEKDRNGSDRNYLHGSQDIHEASIEFQKRVRDIYKRQARLDKNFIPVDCSGEDGNMLPPDDIFAKIKVLTDTYLTRR